MRKKSFIIAAAFCACSLAGFSAEAKENGRLIFIGGGSPTGVYHAVGGAVCKQINKSRRQHGIYCFVEATKGSIDNLNTVRAGELEFGIVQSDWQSRAYNGKGIFEPYGQFKNLRSLFAIHSESFVLLAREGADIRSFYDLRGKRVNIGVEGSASRATMEILMGAFDLTADDFALAAGYSGHQATRALCNGTLDAAVYFRGHPNEDVDVATSLCGAVLVEVSGDPVTRLIKDNNYYTPAVIPGGLYHGNNSGDIKTFGAVATMVTLAETPDEIVLAMVRAVFKNIDRFRTLHPTFMELDAHDMAHAIMAAPLHPAADRYYNEEGMWH